MLDLEREISILRQIPGLGQFLGTALLRLQDGINGLGTNIGADPSQTVPAPPQIQKLNVKANSGLVHATIEDHNPISKGLHYFVEYQQIPVGDPLVFSQPHVEHLGVSRSMRPLALPSFDDNGSPVQYIFHAYSQYPGGHPGLPLHFGGDTPTPVSPGGSTRLTLLPSTGSGTAPTDGQRAGSGFGKVLFRGATTVAKRTAK
jgi:hypothetical protein